MPEVSSKSLANMRKQNTGSRKIEPVKANEQDVFNAIQGQDDETKYRAAAMLAQNNLSDDTDITDQKLKDEIDRIYSGMDAEKSGAEMRGETGLSGMVGQLNRWIDDATLKGGQAIDGVWDTVAGGVGDVIGNMVGEENYGDIARNAFKPEDLQGLVDVGADLALMAGGPVGWGAMIAKNAIQQSPNLAEAFSGKDRITLEDLSEEERTGKALEGGLGIGLSAVPMVGRATNLIREGANPAVKAFKTEQATKRAEQKAYDDAIKSGKLKSPEERGVASTPLSRGEHALDYDSYKSELKAIKKDAKKAKKEGANAADAEGDALESLKSVGENLQKATPFTRAGREAFEEGRKEARGNISNAIKNVSTKNTKRDMELANARTAEKQFNTISDALKKGSEKVSKLRGKGEEVSDEKVSNIVKRYLEKGDHPLARRMLQGGTNALGGSAAQIPFGLANGPSSYNDILDYAEEKDPATAAGTSLGAYSPGIVMALLGSKKGVSPITGRRSPYLSNAALSTNAALKQLERYQEGMPVDGYSEDDILAALKLSERH